MAIVEKLLRNALDALNLVPSTKSGQLAHALIQQSDGERQAAQQKDASDLRAHQAAALAATEQTARDREPLAAHLESAEREFLSARDRLVAYDSAAWIASVERDVVRDHLRARLRRSASPMIETFMSQLSAELDATHRALRVLSENDVDGKPHITWTNQASVERRAAALRVALDDCREHGTLLYRALSDDELKQECARILAALPALDEMPARVRVALSAQDEEVAFA